MTARRLSRAWQCVPIGNTPDGVGQGEQLPRHARAGVGGYSVGRRSRKLMRADKSGEPTRASCRAIFFGGPSSVDESIGRSHAV